MITKNNNISTKERIETTQDYQKWLYDTGQLRRRPLRYLTPQGEWRNRPPKKETAVLI